MENLKESSMFYMKLKVMKSEQIKETLPRETLPFSFLCSIQIFKYLHYFKKGEFFYSLAMIIKTSVRVIWVPAKLYLSTYPLNKINMYLY